MPRRKNQKKVQDDSDEEEVPQKPVAKPSEPVAAQIETPEPTPDAAGAASTSDEVKKDPVPPVDVLYCGVCSLPAEYCEFGSHLTKCKTWLQENHPAVYDRYYSEEALTAKASALTLEQRNKLAASTAKKESKADAKARAEQEKLKDRKLIVKRVERTKRKYITVIQGLESFNIELKAAAKVFAQKFATGASVAKSAPGTGYTEEVVIQGDVAYDLEEMFEEAEKGGGGKGAAMFKDIGDAVEVVEGKK